MHVKAFHLDSPWQRAVLVLVLLGTNNVAFGWIYPEHRDIAALAIQHLGPEYKEEFEQLWQRARAGAEDRLCAQAYDAAQGLAPRCLDWAALPAIAGDHSCSSRQMLETVLGSDWILVVADVAAQLKVDLARNPALAPSARRRPETFADSAKLQYEHEKNRAERLNALRTADTRLQRADSQYAFRADANLAHFMLPRPNTNLDPYAYARWALKPGSELNAAGVYIWFHLSALQKASRLANEPLTPIQRRALTRAVLFDEAFALHFLQDMFAAGHVAGSWGDVSERKGTHDLYNQNGLEVFTWKGRERTVVLTGDAHMRLEDAEFAADAVRASIEQVVATATGNSRYATPYVPKASSRPDAFDVCDNVTFPDRGLGVGTGRSPYRPFTEEVLLDTPVPALGPGLGALPRTKSEVGTFVGLTGAIDARAFDGGFAPSQSNAGAIGGLDVGVRFGLGLEGALGDRGDGLVFGQLGYRAETQSSNEAEGTIFARSDGSLGAAIPSRHGPSIRVRVPFYLIPGDLVLMSPMYLIDRPAYERMAVTAAQGGLIPWQRPWNTPVGRFQFVLGRELGVTWYGVVADDQLVAPGAKPDSAGRLVNYESTFFDIPILEYRPYRAYSSSQSSTVLFQLFAGIDVPHDEAVAAPQGAPTIDLDTVYSLGVRMAFDWRYYK